MARRRKRRRDLGVWIAGIALIVGIAATTRASCAASLGGERADVALRSAALAIPAPAAPVVGKIARSFQLAAHAGTASLRVAAGPARDARPWLASPGPRARSDVARSPASSADDPPL